MIDRKVISLFLHAVLCVSVTAETYSNCTGDATQAFSVTADNKLRLFVDGSEIEDLPKANSAPHADTVNIDTCSLVVALQGKNAGASGGFLGSADSFRTDGTWRCTDVTHAGWEGIEYDDSRWPMAYVVGKHGIKPHQEVEGISQDAYWIWVNNTETNSGNSEKDVYCRKHLEPYSNGTFLSPERILVVAVAVIPLILRNPEVSV